MPCDVKSRLQSPAEILMGFDVDSCAVCFDGARVLAAPRAVRALSRRANVVDLDRRSYTFETRLLKVRCCHVTAAQGKV